jgi:hypothetical protein
LAGWEREPKKKKDKKTKNYKKLFKKKKLKWAREKD